MHDSTLVESFEHAGMHVEIHYDFDPVNPREEWDNFGRMVCWHSRYSLGDGYHHGKPSPGASHVDGTEFTSPDDFARWWKENGTGGVCLPLYLYDHSGLTISTGQFSCPWDSGQVGWIYATREMIQKEHGWKRLTQARRSIIVRCLQCEVETYDQYLTGQVYGYVVREPDTDDQPGQEEDSCWGFFGEEYCKEEARAVAESMQARIEARESPANHIAENI